jgi:hypothetical protein
MVRTQAGGIHADALKKSLRSEHINGKDQISANRTVANECQLNFALLLPQSPKTSERKTGTHIARRT